MALHAVGGSGSSSSALVASNIKDACSGRLTLVTANPAPATDQTGKSTVFFTPYNGNVIALYTASAWEVKTFAEISIALSGLTSGKNYDVYAYNNSGTVALELSAFWTSDVLRADALALQDGVLVKSSDHSRRYLGMIRTTGTTTTEDSEAKRFVCNWYNPVDRTMFVNPGYVDGNEDTFFTITGTTFARLNSGTADTVYFLMHARDVTRVFLQTSIQVSNIQMYYGIGLGSDNPIRAQTVYSTGLILVPAMCELEVPAAADGYYDARFVVRVASGTGYVYTDFSRGGAAADPRAGILTGTVKG